MRRRILLYFILLLFLTGCTKLSNLDSLVEEEQADTVDLMFDYRKTDNIEGEILLKSRVSMERILKKMGSRVLKEWPELGWVLAEVPAGEDTVSFIKKVQRLDETILAEPNMYYELQLVPQAEDYHKQWAFKNINAEPAWDITTGSQNVVVAVIDSGLDINHPEFRDKIIIPGYDATGEGYHGEAMFDGNGHGTHVAGIAADNGKSGKTAGVAWECPILPVRVMDSSNIISTAYLIEAMYFLGDFAEAHPEMRIVANLSIGGRAYNFAFKDAIDYAAERGVLLITSAGNDGKRVLSYPNAYNGVVTVAAIDPFDRKVDFSTTGYWNSVAAPGIQILSTYPDGEYAYLQGTSMAAPFVTGAAALLLSKYPDLPPVEIKNQLEQTARGHSFSEELGYGVIDLHAMLGPLEPMQYGSLMVNTNIDYQTDFVSEGIVTVFDSNGLLVAHGTTGINGNHHFTALKPGYYTVKLFFSVRGYSEAKEMNYVHVGAGSRTDIDFLLKIPEFNEVILEGPIYIDIDESFYDKEITLTEKAIYAIYTEEYTDPDADTTISVLNPEGEIIAYKDFDYHDRLEIELEAGVYTVRIGDYELNDPLNCILYISIIKRVK